MIDVATKKLKPYKQNNRIHPQEQIDLLALQIEKHGFDQPIVCDENYVILKGHARLKAAQLLKMPTVPTIVREGLTESAKRAIRIADNKLSELSTSDQVNLTIEMSDLQLAGYDLKLTGFSDWDVAPVIEEFAPNIPEDSPKKFSEKLRLIIECRDQDELDMLFSELNDRELRVKVG